VRLSVYSRRVALATYTTATTAIDSSSDTNTTRLIRAVSNFSDDGNDTRCIRSETNADRGDSEREKETSRDETEHLSKPIEVGRGKRQRLAHRHTYDDCLYVCPLDGCRSLLSRCLRRSVCVWRCTQNSSLSRALLKLSSALR